jgi:hypothetical protein
MSEKQGLTGFSIVVLCAFNGSLVGLALEELRLTRLRYIMSQAQRIKHPDVFADFFEPPREFLIPLICVITFPVVGYLIHRYFRSRPHALLLTWSVVGAVALWIGYFMSTRSADAFSFVWVLTIAIISYFA